MGHPFSFFSLPSGRKLQECDPLLETVECKKCIRNVEILHAWLARNASLLSFLVPTHLFGSSGFIPKKEGECVFDGSE